MVRGARTIDARGATGEILRQLEYNRMRAARLRGGSIADPAERLIVEAITQDDGLGFVTHVWLMKTVHDEVSGVRSAATTWESLRLGAHGGSAVPIMHGFSEQLDQFILQYLRVNEGFC